MLSECCKVGYSATLARAHVHRFIRSEHRCLLRWGTCAEISLQWTQVLSRVLSRLGQSPCAQVRLVWEQSGNRCLLSLGDLCRQFIA